MNPTDVSCSRCHTTLASVAGAHVLCGWGKRMYAGHRLLYVRCDVCGQEWHGRGPRPKLPLDQAAYADLRCPIPTCRRRLLGKIGEDHVVVNHAGRMVIIQRLVFVQCDTCRRGFDIEINPATGDPQLRASA